MVHETKDVLFAFGLTIFAGLSTGIGSALAFYRKAYEYPFFDSLPKYGEHHVAMYGVVCGMAVMAISLVLFV